MSNIDQQFIEYVVKSLVGKPDAVHVDRRVDEKGVLLELTVDPDDLGRVIGKRGATAQSLRTLLRALGTKNDARYNLKIIDNGTVDHGRTSDSTDQTQPELDTVKVASNVATTDDVASDDSNDPVDMADSDSSRPTESDKTNDMGEADGAASDRLAQTRKELAELDDLDV